MAKFYRVTTLPVLPDYLFQADLSVSIIPPQDFTVVPTASGTMYLHWAKHVNTSDAYTDLYTEVYRSSDLETFELLDTLQWTGYDSYTDSDVSVGNIYYYKIRFVRVTNSVITNTSDYTVTHSGKVVDSLGFEPSDSYSNKFFQFLVQTLPGTRVYDQSSSAHFSADEHLWQTTCKMLNGFNLYVDNALIASAPADATALYAKRNVTFFMTKKQQEIFGKDTTINTNGHLVHINAYLIHTFLMGYAEQFLTLYEKYIQVVADKYIDYPYIYTKGFKPSVSSQKEISIADLYYGFGTLLGLKPLKSQTMDQGIRQYKNALKGSFTNIDNVGRVYGINNACNNIFGMTQQSVLEYNKYHWWKSDREQKLYVIPSGMDQYRGYLMPYGTDNHFQFDLLDDRFWAYTQLYCSPSGVGTGLGEGWLEVLNSGGNTPNTYLFRAHISGGVTLGIDVQTLFVTNPIAASLLSVNFSDGETGAGVLYSGTEPTLIRMHSKYLGWENFNVNMYNKKHQLSDTPLTYASSDASNFSCILSKTDPTIAIPPRPYLLPYYSTNISEYNSLNNLEADGVVLERDDGASGVSLDATHMIYGEKRAILRFSHTVSDMTWLKKASLKVFVYNNTNAGYLRLYRIRKNYDTSDVCWNFREKMSLTGYNLLDGAYSSTTQEWVTKDWTTDGAKDSKDAIYLKEFYIPKLDTPSWVTLDVTDILQNIYKYEAHRLNMGEDDSNILNTGFMLTAEGFPDKTIVTMAGHSDPTRAPIISYEKFQRGYYYQASNSEKYFYVDGTTRWGKLLVLDSNSEPLPYVRTVNERIRQEDIKYTTDVTLTLSSIPVDFVVDAIIYGQTSKAVGTITSVDTVNSAISVNVMHKTFTAETIQILSTSAKVASVSAVSYTGNKYVQLSRLPINGTLLRVYHTGAATTPDAYPSDPEVYSTLAASTSGIAPVFETLATGTYNPFAKQDAIDKTIINLNSTASVSAIGDVIVTYQYYYEFQLLGKSSSDSDSVCKIEGSSRLGYGLYGMSENDYLYRTNVLLPMSSSGAFVDISGNSTIEYSDNNFEVLTGAVGNVCRLNSKSDIFKYALEQKGYRYGTSYHTFLKGT